MRRRARRRARRSRSGGPRAARLCRRQYLRTQRRRRRALRLPPRLPPRPRSASRRRHASQPRLGTRVEAAAAEVGSFAHPEGEAGPLLRPHRTPSRSRRCPRRPSTPRCAPPQHAQHARTAIERASAATDAPPRCTTLPVHPSCPAALPLALQRVLTAVAQVRGPQIPPHLVHNGSESDEDSFDPEPPPWRRVQVGAKAIYATRRTGVACRTSARAEIEQHESFKAGVSRPKTKSR